MNVVLDTNVFVAGVFFSGPPATILRAWRNGRITLAVSPPVTDQADLARLGNVSRARVTQIMNLPALS